MPLKPIFDKAPLTAMTCQPLRAGMVRNDSQLLRDLYALAAADERPSALEGAFRLACLVTARPDEEPVAARIRAVLDSQHADGGFDMPVSDSVAVLRACWALYEYEARKPLLEHAARWCGWAAKNWEALTKDDRLWEAPADLLELLENLYRVTGKAALLTLCERVSAQSMAWSSVLNTIAAQRPTNRTVTREEIGNGMLTEIDSREGYYSRFFRTNHPELLADGARASMARGWYSGSATELGAARNGWERLQRYHGAACGGLTSDELLEGTSPAAAVSTAAVGAWAEALCAAAMTNKADWAWDAVERLAVNAVPACVKDGAVLPFQRVNTLEADAGTEGCFLVQPDHDARALNRLARGCAAIISSAVTACVDGFAVNLYLPGKYAVPVGDALIMMSVTVDGGHTVLRIHCKQETRAVMRLRMPWWSRNAEITINGMDSDAGKDCRGGLLTIERSWRDGDVVDVTLEQSLRVLEAHHQGRIVMRGPALMALSVGTENDWARSLVSCTMENAEVYAVVDRVKEWKRSGGVPADIPVLPAASGEETERVRLVPYSTASARIALFPGRKNA